MSAFIILKTGTRYPCTILGTYDKHWRVELHEPHLKGSRANIPMDSEHATVVLSEEEASNWLKKNGITK